MKSGNPPRCINAEQMGNTTGFLRYVVRGDHSESGSAVSGGVEGVEEPESGGVAEGSAAGPSSATQEGDTHALMTGPGAEGEFVGCWLDRVVGSPRSILEPCREIGKMTIQGRGIGIRVRAFPNIAVERRWLRSCGTFNMGPWAGRVFCNEANDGRRRWSDSL